MLFRTIYFEKNHFVLKTIMYKFKMKIISARSKVGYFTMLVPMCATIITILLQIMGMSLGGKGFKFNSKVVLLPLQLYFITNEHN